VPTKKITHLRTSATVLSLWPYKKYFSHHNLLFSNPTHKTETANRWETTNSKPPRPIKPCSQPPACVKVCYAFSEPPQLFKKCILLSQIDMFWLFFIQCSGPHTEPQWIDLLHKLWTTTSSILKLKTCTTIVLSQLTVGAEVIIIDFSTQIFERISYESSDSISEWLLCTIIISCFALNQELNQTTQRYKILN